MTIGELLTKHDIKFIPMKKIDNINMLKIGDSGVLVWFNNSNTFKLKRKVHDEFSKISNKQVYLLIDTLNKKYYYMKFPTTRNWLTEGFYNCDKNEIFLGKQVMNYSRTLTQVIAELKLV